MQDNTGPKFYLTKEGLNKIKEEYEKLQAVRESKAKEQLPEFLHSDELNPEYASYQEDLSFLNQDIEEHETILKNYELIKAPSKEKQNEIGLGAKVLVDVGGKEEEFTIVGTLESSPELGKISNESPVGRVLLGHKTGEKVALGPDAKAAYKIKKIKYSHLA